MHQKSKNAITTKQKPIKPLAYPGIEHRTYGTADNRTYPVLLNYLTVSKLCIES